MQLQGVLKLSEPVDVFGDFVDRYYESLETMELSTTAEPLTEQSLEVTSESPAIAEIEPEIVVPEEQEVVEEAVEETVVEEKPTLGFVPRSKADVLKAKSTKGLKGQKSTKKVSLSSFSSVISEDESKKE
jgi:transcription elongation factor Elf1